LKLYRSSSFWTKMVLLALVRVHALVFRPGVHGDTARLDKRITSKAEVAAIWSLLLWTGSIVTGRRIAFDN
jgi:hypothetical protein